MKMKTLIKQLSIITALAFLVGCSDTEKVTDVLQETTQRGTVLKTTSSDLNFEVGEDNLISVTAEVIDQRSQDFEKIDVFLSFTDNREDSDPDNVTQDETLFETFAASDLDNSGAYPRLDFDFTGDEFDSFFGIDETDYALGGRITIRMELVMNDGRVFTSTNVNSVVSGGGFYRSPFQYSMAMICQPAQPVTGTWTIDQQDAFGDGWNGAEVVVTIDGTETRYGLDSGSSGLKSFTVPPGTNVISIQYASGDWDSEVTFQVTAANGNTIMDVGPSPAAGTELIDYCRLDYRL
jgi:hypothetical protein